MKLDIIQYTSHFIGYNFIVKLPWNDHEMTRIPPSVRIPLWGPAVGSATSSSVSTGWIFWWWGFPEHGDLPGKRTLCELENGWKWPIWIVYLLKKWCFSIAMWNLEPWNFEWLSIQLGMECHHPKWRTHSIIFQRGRWLNHQPVLCVVSSFVIVKPC